VDLTVASLQFVSSHRERVRKEARVMMSSPALSSPTTPPPPPPPFFSGSWSTATWIKKPEPDLGIVFQQDCADRAAHRARERVAAGSDPPL